ncbi:MAG: autotransporter outer membrane beta-barrel domain-containing protein [Endomicrobia bacterium]|nr:autotransporter outer membrane beta-barrel domain-containing protein [Endomicrobiia bacterium]MCL2799410.1 autotransporter outer membrane beta-barrel domain-containing protein [Endomicrobiia bacterium]
MKKVLSLFVAVMLFVSPAFAGHTVTFDGGTATGNVYGNGPDDTVSSGTENGGWDQSDAIDLLPPDGNTVNFINYSDTDYSVYGGYMDTSGSVPNSANVTANNNTVNITGYSFVSENIYGGYAKGGSGDGNATTDGNTVIITIGSEVNKDVDGGYAYAYGTGIAAASGNTVKIDSSTVHKNVCGGEAYSESGNVTTSSNTVNVIGSSTYYLAGGYNISYLGGGGASDNNAVNIIGSTMGDKVVGGYARAVYGGNAVTASGNTVKIDSSTVSNYVYGGSAESFSGTATANGNSVTIIDSVVHNNIYGGSAKSSIGGTATANDNTVTIIGAPTLSTVYITGGYVETIGAAYHTGNTLNVKTVAGTSIGGIYNFENLNFYIPTDMGDGGTMLNVAYAVNITSSTIGVGINGLSSALNVGDTVTLITSTNGITADGVNTTASGLAGISAICEFDIDWDANNLYAIVTSKTSNKQTKILSEGAAAGAIMVLQNRDNINSSLLNNLQEGKIEIVGAFFSDNSKYDTGSSIEMSAFGASAGIAKKFAAFDAGAFIEYASGSYDTECVSAKGSGDANAIGAAILAKKDINEKVYVEGIIRAGQITNDYKSGLGTSADFDYSAIYFGMSLGAGYIFEVSEKISVDAFGKYAHTNVGSGEADLAAGEKYEFDSVLSNRIKIGTKGEYKINDKIKPYLSLSYDYEISGDVTAKLDGDEVETPSLNGGTITGALGASAKVAEKLTLDLSAQIYSGAREGFAGFLKAAYKI